jgi:hypothetical protein
VPGSGPALAAQPTVTHLHTEGTDLPVQDCGTFVVLVDFVHDETITTYFDEAGTPTRTQILLNFSATLTNSVTGKSAYETGASMISLDLTSGQTRVAGLVLL